MLIKRKMVENRVLVVDLDHTLLRTDMLYETLCSGIGADWRNIFRAGLAFQRGEAQLKRYLASISEPNIPTLPLNSKVLAYVQAWRDAGGRTALVTGSDTKLAEAVASHLGIFDETHGSDGKRNLTGPEKGLFLEARFGAQNFAYIGDSRADIEVWKRANTAITVNASRSLRREAESVCKVVEHFPKEDRSFLTYVRALRPHQWSKNLLVFLPIIASHQFVGYIIFETMLAFVCYCLVASGTYVLNDLLDIEADRAHPEKSNRAFASGALPLTHGFWMIAGLIGAGIGLSVFFGIGFLTVLLVYLFITIAYSLKLKRQIVVDIFLLALLYDMRIVGGAVAASIELSSWLLAFSGFLFLSLAAVKRQAELIDSARRGNSTILGRGYHVDDLPIISTIAIGAGYASVLVMMLYSDSSAVALLYPHPKALWGVCAVMLFWITNTAMAAHRGTMHHDPIVYAFSDRRSQACVVLAVFFVIWAATEFSVQNASTKDALPKTIVHFKSLREGSGCA